MLCRAIMCGCICVVENESNAESNTEDKRIIAELTAKLEEERAKRQSIHKVLGYVVQQLGGNLPVEIAEELAFVGGTPDSSCAWPSSSSNHDPQQKFEFQLMVLDTFTFK
ncbi:hypothetical protein HN51_032792 [Arachis hypogaea]